MDCIFCKIINNEIKSYKLYEDENAIAILDINPLSKGHTLFIPKKHYERLSQMDINDYNKFLESLNKFLKQFENKIAKDYNIIINNGKKSGQEIFHVHIHIVPRYGNEEIIFAKGSSLDENTANEILNKFKA